MTEDEFGLLRLNVEGVRDVPYTEFPEWQLSAVRAVLREQIGGLWQTGTEAVLAEIKQRVSEIEREIARRDRSK